jgi:Flp pilus assembly pilin Flp
MERGEEGADASRGEAGRRWGCAFFWELGMRKIIAFWKDESGTETLEWGLVCGLIVVGAITVIGLIGPKVTDMWNDLNNEIPPAD